MPDPTSGSADATRELRVLVLEDVATDAELEIRQLGEAGFRCAWRRVDTREAFTRELDAFTPDVVLADYHLPGLDGEEALAIVRATHPEVPVIMVTGALGDEMAIALLKAGARDYVLKDKLVRLGSAVERALADERDVRERRRAEEVLKETAETLRAMSEAAFDAIVTWDADGKVTYWNPAAERAFGYPAREALGRDLNELFLPTRHHAALAEGLRRHRETGQGVISDRTLELEAVRKDGTVFPVELSVSPLELGGRRGAVAILRDVGERRRVEGHLRQSQKLESIARLAGGVAHDFNNLLTAILSGVDEILHGLPEPHPLRQEAQEIEAAARKAAALTRQLLVFSRKEVVQPIVLDLNEVLAGVGKMLRRIIGEDIELVIAPRAERAHVKVDPGQLEQVILNLAVNARDAMPRGGRLVIETSDVEIGEEESLRSPAARPGAYVLLTVTDTGCGMDAEVQSHLFEPFFTTKAAGKGTGLGLSTVYGIVTQAGGFLSAHGEPDEGSVFEVHFPLTEETVDEEQRVPASPPAARGTETVLLVEDDPLVRRVAVNVLTAAGYAVVQAAAGDEALRVAAGQGPIDLLVTDLVMPRMRGEDLAESLRRERPALPVLFVSGYSEQGVGPGALGEAAAYLQKPFTPAALTRAVRDLLDRRARATPAPAP